MAKPITPSTIILASKSPRRKELLANAGINFKIIPSMINENNFHLSDPKTYAQLLAEAKASDVSEGYPDCWVIGADSIVVIDGQILEKPDSISNARRMIQLLSGKTHFVHTGYAIICKDKSHYFSDVVSTAVLMKKLTKKEIEWYIHTSEPYDKAGGYAIQGLASSMIKQISGSYTNVVGLPVCEVIDHLARYRAISRNSQPAQKNRAS